MTEEKSPSFFWEGIDPKFMDIEFLQSEAENLRREMQEIDLKILQIQANMRSSEREASPLDIQQIERLNKFKKSLPKGIKFIEYRIETINQIIKDFREDIEKTFIEYQRERGYDEDNLLELLQMIPQLHDIYRMLKDKK